MHELEPSQMKAKGSFLLAGAEDCQGDIAVDVELAGKTVDLMWGKGGRRGEIMKTSHCRILQSILRPTEYH